MTTLLSAIYKHGANLVAEVKSRIAQGEDINVVTEYGESALRVASNHGSFDVVQILLDAGADRDQLRWSQTIQEVVYGTCSGIQQSVQVNGDLESIDFWQRTPFLFAVQLGDIEKAQLLLDLGANRSAKGRCGKTPMQYAVQSNNVAMLNWLVTHGFDIEATDEHLETPLMAAVSLDKLDCIEYLIQNGASIHRANSSPEQPIQMAVSMDAVRLLVGHGADINGISPEMHAELIGVEHNAEPQVSLQDYLAGRHPRFGSQNPEQMDKPFWLAMVRSGASGWKASQKFPTSGDSERLPVWSYQRFGRSTTILQDGRIIEIAGEHEDYYDPDFCIYNDVTEFKADGSIRIFGYPEDVFSPTDFHTATLVGDSIVIIGRLGYPQQRQFGSTPVYRMNVATFEMQRVETHGDQPGWIHRHKARLDGGNRIIVSGGHIERSLDKPALENIDEWVLDLTTCTWSRQTQRRWPQWTFARVDGKPNHLWQIRQALWTRNANWEDKFQRDMLGLSEAMGHTPDLDAVESLYDVDGLTSHDSVKRGDGRLRPVCVDGVTVRVTEDRWLVHCMAEGELSEARLRAFQDGVLAKLARLEGVAWKINVAGDE